KAKPSPSCNDDRTHAAPWALPSPARSQTVFSREGGRVGNLDRRPARDRRAPVFAMRGGPVQKFGVGIGHAEPYGFASIPISPLTLRGAMVANYDRSLHSP